MRSLLIALTIGCTSPHPPATDRLDCYSCHQTEYETAQASISACMKKPDHIALGYGTNCYACHGTVAGEPNPDPTLTRSGWCPAVDPSSPHDVFRIATGSHTGFDCGDCHVALVVGQSLIDASTPQPIECTTCHWHDQDQTDPHHVGKSGYTYSPPGAPTSCLASNCHGGGQRQ
jgi:hypothetical protein